MSQSTTKAAMRMMKEPATKAEIICKEKLELSNLSPRRKNPLRKSHSIQQPPSFMNFFFLLESIPTATHAGSKRQLAVTISTRTVK